MRQKRCALCQQAAAFGKAGRGGGSREELQNLSPLLSTLLSVTARDSDHRDNPKIHVYREPGLDPWDLDPPLLPGDAPGPSVCISAAAPGTQPARS